MKPAKPKSVGNNKEETVTDKNKKIPCYLVTRSHFSPESPIDGSLLKCRNSLGLLLLRIPPIVTFEPHAPELHKLHEHNTKQMTTNNYNYQFSAESHKQL